MNEKPYWIDRLFEKHECFGYDRHYTFEIEHAGRTLRVLVPEYLPEMELKVSADATDPLFLVGRTNEEFEGWGHMGVLVVARRLEEGTFAAVVWHELFPWALKYLGLEQPDPAGGTDG